MEKKKPKRFKKDLNDFGGEEATSSSSSSTSMSLSRGQNQEASDNNGDAQKGVRIEQEDSPMNNLPEEMLLKILRWLNKRSLFKCRLVNRRWCALSSELLRQRYQMEFIFENGNLFHPTKTKNPRQSLKDFLTCMKDSEDCPFARFKFSVDLESAEPSDFFNHGDWIEFLSDFVADANEPTTTTITETAEKIKMKCLELVFIKVGDVKRFANLAEALGVLFLTRIVHIEEFYLNFERVVGAPKVKLFPQPTRRRKSSVPVPVSAPNKLNRLKTIKLQSSAFSLFPGIVSDLLNAANSLQKIHLYFKDSAFTTEMFRLLYSVGKIGCLQECVIHITPQLLADIKHLAPQLFSKVKLLREQKQREPENTPQMFKLETLFLKLDVNKTDCNYCKETSNFLSNLLESSKNTLIKIVTSPLGFLQSSGLQFPESGFKNLKALQLSPADSSQAADSPDPFFPKGIRDLDIFPAVFSLELQVRDWSSGFPRQDFIPRLPSVANLEMQDCFVNDVAISKLALLCPRLKKFRVHKDLKSNESPQTNFLKVGRQIFTHLKTLVSLEIDLDVDLPENNSIALESTLTGISLENRQRLFEMMEVKKTMEKGGSQAVISESELTAEKEHPSILDMPHLKRLRINAYSRGKLLERKKYLCTGKLACISEDFVFVCLPQLKQSPNLQPESESAENQEAEPEPNPSPNKDEEMEIV